MFSEKPLRPTQHAADTLLTRILDGTYPPGASLPGERELAKEIGVTRPTLRENLHRLAAEGWITIRHGKATTVNDYWKTGGLKLLGTLARYIEYMPEGFVENLLDIRTDLIPAIAIRAVQNSPDDILKYLEAAPGPGSEASLFARFDWGLQRLMAQCAKNPIYGLILNDFSGLFQAMAVFYFGLATGRQASLAYYAGLKRAVAAKDLINVDAQVRKAMQESLDIWLNVSSSRANE
ncbi:MAG: GntR family transcriptional regulator [Desulfatibacillaceae bacterium]|nr:GntR family transcriptional regulator [Desulfatibacillaceae bacterium]